MFQEPPRYSLPRFEKYLATGVRFPLRSFGHSSSYLSAPPGVWSGPPIVLLMIQHET